ncbi:MAG: FG-GAP repeat domain-containing protein, partial [Armatimonadota bacterium]
MKTMERWACLEHAWASGTKRRGAARLGYGIAWAGLALLTTTLSAGSGPVIFKPAAGSPFAAGNIPNSVALGDVNGDGRADLAVANSNSNNVSMLLGNGDGSFRAAVNFAAGDFPSSVAIGDVSGDGRPDLAVANINSGNVSVLLGNGNGSFQPAVNFAADGSPFSVAIGDVNRDGWPDLAVTIFRGNVRVLLGKGDGTFQPAVHVAAGAAGASVAIGDLNRDGRPDLALAHFAFTSFGSDGVSVLLGNGDGSFQSAVSFAVGDSPRSVAIGDVNRDGRPDLAVANVGSN